MSKDQKLALDGVLRQGGLDLQADVPTLRASFNELMARIPRPTMSGRARRRSAGQRHRGHRSGSQRRRRDPLLPRRRLRHRLGGDVGPLGGRTRPAHGRKGHHARLPTGAGTPVPGRGRDAQNAYRGLLEQGVDPGQIALAGESAGGGLAVATLLGLRDAGTPLPSCAFLMSPYADLTLSGDSIADREAVDRTLTPAGLRLRIPDYVAGADAADPLISPVFGDLTGLPPLLIQVGSNEILLSDALRLAERAAMADVTVTLDVTDGVPHVFQAFAAMLDEAGAALDRASTFLRTNLAATERLGAA